MTDTEYCTRVDENMSDVLEGVADAELFDHLATCERCRDARHDAEQNVERVRDAARDYRCPSELEARVLARIAAEPTHKASSSVDQNVAAQSPVADAAVADDEVAENAVAEHPLESQRAPLLARGTETAPKLPTAPLQRVEARVVQDVGSSRRRSFGLMLGAAAVLLGLVLLQSREPTEDASAGSAWHGEVVQLERAFGSPSGLSACTADGACQPLAKGATIAAGARLETDGLTRALVKFSDGTSVALDRASRLELDAAHGRRARLAQGNLVAEVQELPGAETDPAAAMAGGAARAVIDTLLGRAEVFGTKFSLVTEPSRARVEVSRGVVRFTDGTERSIAVHAGEAGQISREGAPRLEYAADLGRSFAWSSEAFEPEAERESHGALGVLTAKRPRDQAELQGAVQLTQHDVQVQIVDNIARTQVEEVFTNQTDEVLEGIFRFPLPPGAQIERLALDVDGKLVDGAFVDRERAAAIWRGAIVNSGGKKPPPVEEIIWVPGPWRDPALLEWQRGNRFELRIFPIPRHSSRRIVLAYTEVLGPTEGARQYVYPLPQDPGGSTRIERFTLDVQVRGHDEQRGVSAHGYPLQALGGAPGVARLSFDAQSFSPSGDLVLDYQLANSTSPLRAWAYQPQPIDPPTALRRTAPSQLPHGTTPATGSSPRSLDGSYPAQEDVRADAPYVALSLRPELPRRAEYQPRDYVFAVDTSRSMIGESYRRAVAVVERTIGEMDRHDRVSVIGCDSVCQSWPGGYRTPGGAAAEAAGHFLRGIVPEGASDLAYAIERAATLGERNLSRALRVVYVGDGTPTVGPIHPALLRRAVQDALPRGANVSAVAIGSDADRASLQVMTEAGGGVTLAFAPGQSVADVAYALLGATYGHTLKNARLELPEGLVAVAPQQLGSIAAGAEELVVARLLRPDVSGTAVLRGELAGEEFEQRYELRILPSTSEGNAFVPRLYAAVMIGELESAMDEGSRRRSIELSTRFNVASRYTSLLVLESPAMFKAFGLDNQRQAPEWSGTQSSEASETWGGADVAGNQSSANYDALSGSLDEEAGEEGVQGGSVSGSGSGVLGDLGRAAPAKSSRAKRATDEWDDKAPGSGSPAPKPASPAALTDAARQARARAAPDPDAFSFGVEEAKREENEQPRDRCGCGGDLACAMRCAPEPEWRLAPEIEPSFPRELPQQRMIPMRRVYDRVGKIDAPPRLLDLASPSRRASLAARVQGSELSRSALKELYVLDFLSGDLDRAADDAERWSAKDPLDPDALTARADLAAQQGQRELAIRILGSVVDVRPGDYKSQWRLARLHRWAGDAARGCRHSLAVAQLKLSDAKLVAEGVRCSREVGQRGWADDLLGALTPQVLQEVQRLQAQPRPADELSGDLRVQANWQGAAQDLDLVIVHPDGYRVSWLGAPTRAVISATDVLSVHREGLALRGAEAGQYGIEVVRSTPSSGAVRGSVELLVGKEQRTLPFVLEGERLRIATAQLRLSARLVPLEGFDAPGF